MPGSRFEKIGGIFVDCLNKKGYELVCFLNIPGKQQHCNLTNGELVYCFLGESNFFDKN